MVFREGYCKKCGEKYTNVTYKWCKQCQLSDLKTNLTSGNEKIDNLIQEMQFSDTCDIVFQWIPYNQFNNIREIKSQNDSKIYSALWKNGPLIYNDNREEYTRIMNEEVDLKCLCNSQNIPNEFINEV